MFQKYIPQSKSVRGLILIAFLLRVIPLLLWLQWPCVRDECTYLRLSERMLMGEGMTASSGWIWAPGYPFLIALHQAITGYGAAIKTTQSIVSIGVMILMYNFGRRIAGEKAGLWALVFYAFSPTQIFFAQSLWSECLYGGLLLLALYCFDRSSEDKERVLRYAMITGLLVGICVLFRGVATYMLPIFAFAFWWKRWFDRKTYQKIGMLFLMAILTVAPYSIYASNKFGSFMVSDRTLGQMMWLGNNDFEPIAFDWGNGPLSNKAFERHVVDGREPCAKKREPVVRDKCQTHNGIEWIKAHPEEFIQRIPLRIAQMLNPHSFLTRHIRWGFWLGAPRVIDEILILLNVVWNLLVMWGGVLGLITYGRKAREILIGGILLYHIAAISILAGLTRYRVPLEPLLMLYLAWVFSRRKELWEDMKGRRIIIFLGMACLIPFTLWFLPTGWLWWRHW